MSGWHQSAGQPWPLGASKTDDGVNFAVASRHAQALWLCLFSADGDIEDARIPITARSGEIWHIHLRGLDFGTVYGFRAQGPSDRAQGHWFDPAKLLLDPYARRFVGRIQNDHRLRDQGCDSAPAMAKAQLIDTGFDWQGIAPPRHAMAGTILYEVQVKALTQLHPDVEPEKRGRYLGVSAPAMLAHYRKLGITAIELLPVQAHLDEAFLIARGLSNHWGYNTHSFFAPDPRFARADPLREFQTMVRELHGAGIEVILDVVYNHSAESDALGPILNLRGLDNASYYRLGGDGGFENHTGTGNMLDLRQPMALRLVMDSLRYWVETCHVDGFRFDLAGVLGRESHGFDANAAFFRCLAQDPVLAGVKWIAEPWDIGPQGYQLGRFPRGFSEWNDRFRDGLRRFWRGDAGQAPLMAAGLLGSADLFDHELRAPQASVNFLTAHDGFTLQDLLSYGQKHNDANGEDNRDGHHDNLSDNLGHEGPDGDPARGADRSRRKAAMLASLMLSQGVPMLLAGDEIGHSQRGNNNAYAQDNAITWLDWSKAGDDAITGLIARLSSLRHDLGLLRQTRFLHGRDCDIFDRPDVSWWLPCGRAPQSEDWQNPALRAFGLLLRDIGDPATPAVLIYFNAGNDLPLQLPTAEPWDLMLDTSDPAPDGKMSGAILPRQSVLLFRSAPGTGPANGDTA